MKYQPALCAQAGENSWREGLPGTCEFGLTTAGLLNLRNSSIDCSALRLSCPTSKQDFFFLSHTPF